MAGVLRVAIAGSVDDGKSTLVGRLLHDTKALMSDQLAAVERAGRDRGGDGPDLALVTDGLRAEREQGITIDVAYRYLTTPSRKIVLADTPGHVQYTRNMVTGASTADVALVLVDASRGISEQSRRHAVVAGLLAVRHVVVCVNKMDLVDWSADVFHRLRAQFTGFAAGIGLPEPVFVPMSALHGDNVVDRGSASPWYGGPPLLRHLEEVRVAPAPDPVGARLPVQYVVRGDERRYAGTVAAGAFRPGDDVVVLPSGRTTTVRDVRGPGGTPLAEAVAGQAVTVALADHVDVGRGDLLCLPNDRPFVGTEIDAVVCWLSDRSALTPGARYLVQHTSRVVPARVRELTYRLDVTTLDRDASATALSLNEIGGVRLRTTEPLAYDAYGRDRTTGGFVLVDEATHDTVAAGMVVGPAATRGAVWQATGVDRAQRATAGATVWLTGLPAAGKSSIAVELEHALVAAGRPACLLDGDNLRHGLNADLGFRAADRAENVRRVGEVAQLFADAGVVAVVSLVSPYRADRDRVRDRHRESGLPFVEVFVDTPITLCRERDPKGLYAKARRGEITGVTGVDAPYQAPLSPELVLRPEIGGPAEMAAAVLDFLGR